MQVDALADLVAQRAGVVHQPRRTGEVLRAAGLGEALGEPHPQVHRPAPAVRAGLQPGSRIRANNTAMPIRPSGVMNSRNPATIHHQPMGAAHGTRSVPRRRCWPTASQITHCSPVSVASGSVSATWTACVSRGVGFTMRVSTRGGGSRSSRNRPAIRAGGGRTGRRQSPGDTAAAARRPAGRRTATRRRSRRSRPRDLDRRGEHIAPQPGHPAYGATEVGRFLASSPGAATAARRGPPCRTYGWAVPRRAPVAARVRRAASRPACARAFARSNDGSVLAI